jgi:serine phosphatase RsbU (regulator of sigma subunit)
MRKLLTALSFLLGLITYSQNYGDKKFYLVDSLDLDKVSEEYMILLDTNLVAFHSTSNDSLRLHRLGNIVMSCWDINIWPKYNDIYHDLARQELRRDTSYTYYARMMYHYSHALNNKGFYASRLGDTKAALYYFEKCLGVLIEIQDMSSAAHVSNNIASAYQALGNIDKAMDYFRVSIKLHQRGGDRRGMGSSIGNLAIIYADVGDTATAEKYYNVVLELYKESNERRGMGLMYLNLAKLETNRGNYEGARKLLYKGLKIHREINEANGIAGMILGLGKINYEEGNLDSSLIYFNESLDRYNEIGDKRGLYSTNMAIARVMKDKGETKLAEEHALKAASYADYTNMPDNIKEASEFLSEFYHEQDDYKKALEYHMKYVKMKDSVQSTELIMKVSYERSQFEYQKEKELSEAEHEQELAQKQSEKERQSIITYASLGGLLVVAILLYFVFSRLKVTRKQKRTIEWQKTMVEQAHFKLEEKNQEIIDSINYAKRIQTAILPPDKIVKRYLPNSFILYKPKDIVAGDFYWLEGRENGVFFAAADCTGHGVPGAMVSVICNNGLNRSVREFGLTDPGEILDKTREIVVKEFEKSEEEVKDGMDIALCTLQGKTLKYAGAHNPLWIVSNGELTEIKANKQPVGKFEPATHYDTHSIELKSGDTVYIFSDGYADQFGGDKGKKFKAKQLKDLILSIQDLSMDDQKQRLDESFENWRGKLEQLDDVCFIGVKVA